MLCDASKRMHNFTVPKKSFISGMWGVLVCAGKHIFVWDVDTASLLWIRQDCLFDVFEYNKGKNLYAAFDVIVTEKFSKVIRELPWTEEANPRFEVLSHKAWKGKFVYWVILLLQYFRPKDSFYFYQLYWWLDCLWMFRFVSLVWFFFFGLYSLKNEECCGHASPNFPYSSWLQKLKFC